ncbi:MAG: hypothetical protein HY704_01550 [Gemmatimonadetes bacterium]|nr:hypothetical protein [Gemmatimonadota bacterium]
MLSSEPARPTRRERFGLWLALAWFVAVNAIFYWQLFAERAAELGRISRRLLAAFQ